MSSPENELVQKKNIYELVADRLMEMMRDQPPANGMLPSVPQLTERFGVGRSSVREALRMLESRGVIVALKHGQFKVSSSTEIMRQPLKSLMVLNHTSLDDVFTLRRIMEPAFAELAAQTATEADLVELEGANKAVQEALPDRRAMLVADLRFHRAVATASGSRLGVEVVDALHSVLQEVLVGGYYVSEVAVEQHEAIRQAIVAHDPQAAREHMAVHMGWIADILDSEA